MEHELSFVGHLEELRRRFLRALFFLVVCSCASIPYSSSLLMWIKVPAGESLKQFVYFSPQEGFMVLMRIGFCCGFVLSLPLILRELWLFVAPAIEQGVKRSAAIFIVAGFLSFLSGVCFGYYCLLPAALRFLLGVGGDVLVPLLSAERYVSFVLSFLLACGLVFQMPIVSFFLTKMGVVNAGFLRRNFKYAVVVIVIVAAVITPTTDIFNMGLMALPMLALYEFSIWVSFVAGHKGRV